MKTVYCFHCRRSVPEAEYFRRHVCCGTKRPRLGLQIECALGKFLVAVILIVLAGFLLNNCARESDRFNQTLDSLVP